jgi:hypothetical protein
MGSGLVFCILEYASLRIMAGGKRDLDGYPFKILGYAKNKT